MCLRTGGFRHLRRSRVEASILISIWEAFLPAANFGESNVLLGSNPFGGRNPCSLISFSSQRDASGVGCIISHGESRPLITFNFDAGELSQHGEISQLVTLLPRSERSTTTAALITV